MSQLWSTGPALFYVGYAQATGAGQANAFSNTVTINNSNAKFLGTCEEKPQIEIEYLGRHVREDRGGEAPTDKMYQGQHGSVVADLIRFNYPIALALVDQPNTANAIANALTPTRGSDAPGDVGTLLVTENNSFVLYVVFPYAAKAAYGAGNLMVAGYRFWFATLNKDTIFSGTQPHKTRFMFDCIRGFGLAASGTLGVGEAVLYDFNTAGLPSPN